MNLPWILGTIAAISFFAYFEWRAFQHPERQNTLSRWIYNMGSNWPLSIFLMGMLCGGLAVHFFWHWCPAVGQGVGLLSPGAINLPAIIPSDCVAIVSTTGECLSRGRPL